MSSKARPQNHETKSSEAVTGGAKIRLEAARRGHGATQDQIVGGAKPNTRMNNDRTKGGKHASIDEKHKTIRHRDVMIRGAW